MRTIETKKVSVGTVISGTMNPTDLIPAFLAELDYLEASFPDLGESPLYSLIDYTLSWIDEESEEMKNYLSSDDCQWDLESLFDSLNDLAPEYCHFGSHEGNYSDYGFWPDIDSIEYDLEVGELSKSRTDGLWVDVNDHGNVTLWNGNTDGTSNEIWSYS